MSPEEHAALAAELQQVAPQLPQALTELTLPAFVLGRDGGVRWQNAAAIELLGDRRGSKFTAMLAPHAHAVAEEHFARKLLGAERAAAYPVTVVRRDGTNVAAEIESVPLEDGGEVCGVFGVIDAVPAPPAPVSALLTPRQLEVLRLLAAGATTASIAAGLHLSTETVRNHVRAVLRALGAHSRLQAVLRARELGLV